jgi:hypothetical protein
VKKRAFLAINYAIAVLTLISCGISIANNDLYQDGTWANAQWLGQDIVTLFIALPFLLLSTTRGVAAGETKWAIVNAGILLYYAYTYSFFMFAAQLTVLYLFHLPIYGLSVIGFVLACIHLFGPTATYDFPNTALKRVIIAYLVLIALMISFIWLSDIFAHLTNPDHRSATPNGEAPLIIYSLDLGLIIPLMLIAAVLLHRQAARGYVLTGIILTKTSTLGFALMAMALSMYVQQLDPEFLLIVLWCIIGLAGTLLTALYLKQLNLVGSSGPPS